MRLKFFEKNEVENTKTGITTTTNDSTQSSDIEDVRNKNGSFTSENTSSESIRDVSKNIALTSFSTDGESFTAPFKRIDVERGDPALTSRSSSPSNTKSISTQFTGTAVTPPLSLSGADPSGVLSQPDITVPRTEFEPYIGLTVGGNQSAQFLSGFSDPNYSKIRNALLFNSNSTDTAIMDGGEIFDIGNFFTSEEFLENRFANDSWQIPSNIPLTLIRTETERTRNTYYQIFYATSSLTSGSQFVGSYTAASPILKKSTYIFNYSLLDHSRINGASRSRFEPVILLLEVVEFERFSSARRGTIGSDTLSELLTNISSFVSRTIGDLTIRFPNINLGVHQPVGFPEVQDVATIVNNFNLNMNNVIENEDYLEIDRINGTFLRNDVSNPFLQINNSRIDPVRINTNSIIELEEVDSEVDAGTDIIDIFVNDFRASINKFRLRAVRLGDRPQDFDLFSSQTPTGLTDQSGAPVSIRDALSFDPKTDNTATYTFTNVRENDDETNAEFSVVKRTNPDAEEDPDTGEDSCEIDSITGRITFDNTNTPTSDFDLGEFTGDNFLLIDEDGRTTGVNFAGRRTISDLERTFFDVDERALIVNSRRFFETISHRQFTLRDWVEAERRADDRANILPLTEFRPDDRIEYMKLLLTERTRSFRFIKTTGQSAFELLNQEAEGNQTIISELNDREFPFVRVNDITYNESTNNLILTMSRVSDNAPIPSPDFFDAILINNRRFNFENVSDYRRFLDPEDPNNPYGQRIAEYTWQTATNPSSRCGLTYPIEFVKDGESITSAFDLTRPVHKSTIRSEMRNIFPSLLGGFRLENIEYDNNLTITFDESNMDATSFYSIAIKDKDNTNFVTRELKATDATITGGNTFIWAGLPEFLELRDNKDYTIEMKKSVTQTEDRFFVTNPSGNFHFVRNIEHSDDSFSFTLDSNGSLDVKNTSPVIHLSLTDSMNNPVIANTTLLNFDIDSNIISVPSVDLSSVTVGNYVLTLGVEDLNSFEVTFTKMTDFCFDTIVIFDTNLDDISIRNSLGSYLIHPTDKLNYKEINEDGRRHILFELKNPIVSPEIILENKRLVEGDLVRRLGQVFLLKNIGTFSQFPFVKVRVDTAKTNYKSQLNLSHIKSLPESINYSLEFPPLEKQSDLELAQDLFSRLSNYNEFITWVSGGEVENYKVGNMKGFRFVDLIKSLALNNFNFQYVDGRLSSGINFVMEVREVL